MNEYRGCLWIIIWISATLVATAQSTPMSNLRIKTYRAIADSTQLLDTLSIIPQSVVVMHRGQFIDPSKYTVDWQRSTLTIHTTDIDTVWVKYRVFSFYLPQQYDLSDEVLRPSQQTSIPIFQNTQTYKYVKQDSRLKLGDIDYNGSFFRGFSVGNNQDLVLHSGLNMNLKGILANGIEIVATINDANIPLQPEGTSASIQEFDRLYIQMKKDKQKLTLGDFDISQMSGTQFMRFDRKLQGINFVGSADIDNDHTLNYGATLGVTRGVFARNVFEAKENQQGPYRLYGNNGETFLIVIAGTERVYINGQLMARGYDRDYTINYNLGEITFTTKRLITQDLRIVVEFQYSDRNYFRYTLESRAEYHSPKLRLYNQVYFETDDQNQPLNQKFNETQIDKLKSIGNQINDAWINAEKLVPWEGTRILYRMYDTVVQGVLYRDIFEWQTTPSDSAYAVTFTLLGANRGHYRLRATNANGAVYEWVEPIDGIPQGSFEPILKIATPKNHLQTVLGASYELNRNIKMATEWSYTYHDLNLYSTIDNDKNRGLAGNVALNYHRAIDSIRKVSIDLNHEITTSRFSPVTRFRSLEFNRDWDIDLASRNERMQNHTQVSAKYSNSYSDWNYIAKVMIVDSVYRGVQQIASSSIYSRRIKWQNELDLLLAKPTMSATQFWRPRSMLTLYLDSTQKWHIKAGAFIEKKSRTFMHTDSLIEGSFDWQNYSINIGSKPTLANRIDLEYIYRTESYANRGAWEMASIRSHTVKLTGALQPKPTHQFIYTLTYRNFHNLRDTTGTELNHQYMGRLEYSRQLSRGWLRSNSIYEIKAGREQKTQLSYIRAPNGYGTYAWNDLNNNGIFELDEAYVSVFPLDNRYVRFYTQLPEFVPSNDMIFSQFVWIQPKAIWHQASGLGHWLSKLAYQVRLDLNRKQLSTPTTPTSDYFNPLMSIQNESVLTSRVTLNQVLSYQKNDPNTSVELEHNYSDLKSLMTNGYDGFSLSTYNLRVRQSLSTNLSLNAKVSNNLRVNRSEFFKDRNFKMIHNELENTLTYMASQWLKLNLNAMYWFKSTGPQFAINKQIDLSVSIARKHNGISDLKLSILSLDYLSSIANQQVELTMLQGLQSGTNYIVTATFGQKITDVLHLNLLYNGRYNSQNTRWIHNANIEMRAMF